MTKASKQTNSDKRHILVAVSGTTPQIVTETLYKLVVNKTKPVPISEVHVLTTKKGAEIAWKALGGPTGAIAKLCKEYAIKHPIAFRQAEHIHVFKSNQKGKRRSDTTDELEDIRTSADNEAMASQMLGLIKELTNQRNSVLHCSLAGGRRTMSVYLMLGLMLYGGAEDRLSHVLVPQEFETNRNFFFPPKKNEIIDVTINGNPAKAQTKNARIELADIPFVRLRSILGAAVAKVEKNLNELIRIAQSRIDRVEPDKLVIDLRQGVVSFGTQRINLRGVNLALLTYYAKLKTAAYCKRPDLPDCLTCENECYVHRSDINRAGFQAIFDALYARVKNHREAAHEKATEETNIKVYHKRINDEIAPFSIRIEVVRGEGRYGLSLDKNLIQLIES